MTDSASIAATFGDEPPTADAVRPLGWGRMILQVGTVLLAYYVPQVIAPFFFIELPTDGRTIELTSTATLASVCSGAVCGILAAWLWLRADRATGRAWNFSVPLGWNRTIGWGIAGAVAVALIFLGGSFLLGQLGMDMPDVDLIMDFVTESPLALLLWIVLVAILAAGLGEELIYRGFILDRFMHVKGLRSSIWPAAVLQALLFSMPHAYQGVGGIILTGVVGLFFAWMRMQARWSLWPLVIAHALYDTVALTAGYGDSAGWFG